MATTFARVGMISKDLATTYFMTSITGKRTIQKCINGIGLSNVIFATKIVYTIHKNEKFIFYFLEKKITIKTPIFKANLNFF